VQGRGGRENKKNKKWAPTGERDKVWFNEIVNTSREMQTASFDTVEGRKTLHSGAITHGENGGRGMSRQLIEKGARQE